MKDMMRDAITASNRAQKRRPTRLLLHSFSQQCSHLRRAGFHVVTVRGMDPEQNHMQQKPGDYLHKIREPCLDFVWASFSGITHTAVQ